MKLKPYKNDYGYMRVDCPFCGYDAKYHENRNPEYKVLDPLRDLKRHITNASKNEALRVQVGEDVKTPHLDYYKAHTAITPVMLSTSKRGYDSDLTV